MKKYLLAEMRPKEAEEAFKKTDIALIPTGTIHPHGAGVPLGLDAIMAEELADRIGKKTDVIVLPTIYYGYGVWHGDFPGAINISPSTKRDMLLEICEWLHRWGIKKILWMNCHGGDEPMVKEVAYYIRNKWNMLSAMPSWSDIAIKLVPECAKYFRPYGEGLTEDMSRMLYLRPNLVNVSEETYKEHKQLLGDKIRAMGLMHSEFKGVNVRIFLRTKDLTDTSGFGPSIAEVDYVAEASAELGERMVTAVVDFLVEFIEEFRKVRIPPL
jgi:creatinine amidohydrolase